MAASIGCIVVCGRSHPASGCFHGPLYERLRVSWPALEVDRQEVLRSVIHQRCQHILGRAEFEADHVCLKCGSDLTTRLRPFRSETGRMHRVETTYAHMSSFARNNGFRTELGEWAVRWVCTECDFKICTACAVACAKPITEPSSALYQPPRFSCAPGKLQCNNAHHCNISDPEHFNQKDHNQSHPRIMLDTLDARGYDVSAARVDFTYLSSSQILMDNVEAEVDCRAPEIEANVAFASAVSSAIHIVAPQRFPITLGDSSLLVAQLRECADANVATVLGKRQRTLALTAASGSGDDDETPPPKVLRLADRMREWSDRKHTRPWATPAPKLDDRWRQKVITFRNTRHRADAESAWRKL